MSQSESFHEGEVYKERHPEGHDQIADPGSTSLAELPTAVIAQAVKIGQHEVIPSGPVPGPDSSEEALAAYAHSVEDAGAQEVAAIAAKLDLPIPSLETLVKEIRIAPEKLTSEEIALINEILRHKIDTGDRLRLEVRTASKKSAGLADSRNSVMRKGASLNDAVITTRRIVVAVSKSEGDGRTSASSSLDLAARIREPAVTGRRKASRVEERALALKASISGAQHIIEEAIEVLSDYGQIDLQKPLREIAGFSSIDLVQRFEAIFSGTKAAQDEGLIALQADLVTALEAIYDHLEKPESRSVILRGKLISKKQSLHLQGARAYDAFTAFNHSLPKEHSWYTSGLSGDLVTGCEALSAVDISEAEKATYRLSSARNISTEAKAKFSKLFARLRKQLAARQSLTPSA